MATAHRWTPPPDSILNGADDDLERMSDSTLNRLRQTAEDLHSLARQMGKATLAYRAGQTMAHLDGYLEDRRWQQYVIRREQVSLPFTGAA